MAGRIEDYGLIGDLQTAALVDRDGSIDWLCLAGRSLVARTGQRRLVYPAALPRRLAGAGDGMGNAEGAVRVVEGCSGRVLMVMELVQRFDYGAVSPWVRRVDGQWSVIAGPDAVWLNSEWPEAVRCSLVTLKALAYAPTGGIVAAATTSLPEQLGGPRNWDYRYCWLRDATFTLQVLLGTGYVEEAKAWREWLLRAAAGDSADLRIPEYTLDWLGGYEGSRPVRVGNAAAGQYQLDVWGEVLDGLHLARETGLDPSEDAWELQQALLEFLEGHWDEPDNSLWEVRGARRPFVHSRLVNTARHLGGSPTTTRA